MTEQGREMLMGIFNMVSGSDPAITEFTRDPAAALDRARVNLEAMTDSLAYLDNPTHPMAGSMFFCAVMLAMYKSLEDEGVTAHQYGARMLKVIRDQGNRQPAPDEAPAVLVEAAEESQSSAKPNEFVFEILEGNEDYAYGMNIRSCAICHLYSQHDAMDLVPYMCASDDVISDASAQGLKRTGSIAVGAHQCDFRFKPGGEGLHLSDQYPDKIRILE